MKPPHLRRPDRAMTPSALLVASALLLLPGPARAQACTGVTIDPPISGGLDFGRLYVAAGAAGTATLDPATGQVSTTGRLVGGQTGAPLQLRVTDADPDCEFILRIAPASQDFAPSFSVEADRITVLEGALLNADPAAREWLVRMSGGVARIAIGGRLEMNTASESLIDSYVVSFTASVDPS